MSLSETIVAAAKSRFSLTDITPPAFAAFRWPKPLPLIRFTVSQYKADFGNLAVMDTVAMGGLMRLSTVVFTPCAGQALPVMLIDGMTMAKKALTYVEYYDCTAAGASLPKMAEQPAEFAALPDYEEKPAWYIERRMPCSLIKGGDGVPEKALGAMAMVCVERYLQAAEAAGADAANLPKLRAFQRDMLERGNPSSATLNRALGQEKARLFFKTVIMPVDQERSLSL